jgi:hypothetical protein
MIGVARRPFFDANFRDMDNALLTMRERIVAPFRLLHLQRLESAPWWARSRRPTTHDGQPCGVVNNVQPALIDCYSCGNMRALARPS